MDRVDLTHQTGVNRQRRWQSGGAQEWRSSSVVFGRLVDGRWFAGRTGRLADVDDHQLGACVFTADEQGRTLALRLAYRWMAEAGDWRAQPAAFGPDGAPLDGLPWVKRGGAWFLEG